MTTIAFTEWPKIPRLRRTCSVTEKIDGMNTAVGVVEMRMEEHNSDYSILRKDGTPEHLVFCMSDDKKYIVYAQTRTQFVSADNDVCGFGLWVFTHAFQLAETLGKGVHFGEWWGSGIGRGYGLTGRCFSLFNTKRWKEEAVSHIPGLHVVPTLYEGDYDAWSPWDMCLSALENEGSVAAPGFMRPEGVVVYHHAANTMMKVTLENDNPKST